MLDGSSPLARGLLRYGHDEYQKGRIIPARAGFTTTSLTSSPDTRDHPRSRGVYNMIVPISVSWLGSSPLARGLP